MAEIITNADLTAVTGGAVINNQDISVTENGTYTADEGYTGLGTVNVNVSNPMETARATMYCNNGYNSSQTIIIDENGIASGFRSTEFLQFPFLVKNSDWELILRASISEFAGVLCANNFGSTIGQLFCLWLSNNKVNLGIYNNGIWEDITGVTNLSTNNYYFIKLIYNGFNTFSLYISEDEETWNKEFDKTCTLDCYGILTIGLDNYGSGNNLRGNVDLAKSSLKIGENTYKMWSAND